MTNQHTIDVIGHVRSPFKEKFGLPRQPGQISSAHSQIVMEPSYSDPAAFRELEGYSHVWLSFIFHQSSEKAWKPTVRPPRLGGNTRVGVFASRSPFRPNHLGLSVVELFGYEKVGSNMVITIACPDLVDGTPIVDIKPYLAYVDAVNPPKSGYAETPPKKRLSVELSADANSDLVSLQDQAPKELHSLILETIALDPRPAYKTELDTKTYTFKLYDYEVSFKVDCDHAIVTKIRAV